MNADDYLDAVEALLASEEGVTDAAVDLAEEATRAHPASAELWCLRGRVLQLYDGPREFTARDYVDSYEQALACDPANVVALEELGYQYDVYFNDFSSAESHFRRAIALGAGEDSYVGLARVLAQDGRADEALTHLSPAECIWSESEKIGEMRQEIASGSWNPAPPDGDEPS